MSYWPLDNPAECEQFFQERYHRPPPWYEFVSIGELEELAWAIGTRLKMSPSSIDLRKVCAAAWAVMEKSNRECAGAYRGHTEPLSRAHERLRFPTDGVVLLWRDCEGEAVRVRCKDLLSFESAFWGDFRWLVDEEGGWILAGMHDWAACWLDFRPKRG